MITKMEKEMKYVAPEVEVVLAEVEFGFAGSPATDSTVETPEPNW